MSWIVGGSVIKAMTRISPAEMGHRTRIQPPPRQNRAPIHDENERPLTQRRRSALRKIDRLQRVASGRRRQTVNGHEPSCGQLPGSGRWITLASIVEPGKADRESARLRYASFRRRVRRVTYRRRNMRTRAAGLGKRGDAICLRRS